MIQFWVYILRCRDGSYYTGHTDDMDKRMWEHEQGLAADWTRRRRPVQLMWCDWTGSRYEALEFERRVKRWSRAKKEALIAGDWARVGYFARPPHERPSIETLLNATAVKAPASLHHERPSTSLGTNEAGDGIESPAPKPCERPSTSLGTNEAGDGVESPAPAPHGRPSTSLGTNALVDCPDSGEGAP